MSHVFAVLGAGMQGTAAAYDLAKFANPERVLLGDVSFDQAKASAHRVNTLLGTSIVEPHKVDAMDPQSLAGFLHDSDIVLSCVPYWMHPRIAKVAVATKTNMVDLGGNTDITHETLALDEEAKAAGVTLVPDTGLAPGLVNSLGLWAIEQMDEAEMVKLYCGVLPQNPVPPLNYKLTFNVEGLVTEYDFQGVTLRDGNIHMVDTLTELEELEIDELGKMEAFVTSGGTSTAPYTLKGRVPNYEYKTIRFPGHCQFMKLFKDSGLWSFDAVTVPSGSAKPREIWYKVFGDYLSQFVDKDLCAIRAIGIGKKNGQPVRHQIDILDRQCEETGFTSMERLTGFSMSIYAIEVVEGRTPKGGVRYENAVTGTKFVEEIQKRGIKLRFS
ncbi:MAG: saccharopine dehydrogenase NADP-binding domain-containing protein [Armatimonadetes bacterium]|nr:saccharopine dehydrogenase NADP-binding domain-containing protein [Armatimonadota bacterium]